MKIETKVFDEIKNNPYKLNEDPSDIILLLNGYLLFAKSSERL
jgi:hypothetical protein